MENLVFKQLNEEDEIGKAFSLYPDDWKKILLPAWSDYTETARVFALLKDDLITTLGILFYDKAPEMEAFPETAQILFREGKPYIGFIYTLPKYRGRGYASLWLKKLRESSPGKSFWLTVEDPSLIGFYQSHGFHLHGKSDIMEEWLLRSDQNNNP